MIRVSGQAPAWASDMAKSVQDEIDARIYPYVSSTPFSIALLPDPTTNAWKKVFLSDGTGGIPEAVSNGTAWVYPDGTPV